MNLLELGVANARAGNIVEARMYLEALTLQEPDNAQALLWLSCVLDNPKLSMRCLERVLEIDPGNAQARRGLDWLRSHRAGPGISLPQRIPDAEMSAALRALGHVDPQAVVKAIRRLGEAGDSRAVEPLTRLLTTSADKTVQAQARAALIAIGTPAVEPALKWLMAEANADVALRLAAVLAQVRSMAALIACREVVERAPRTAARYAMAVNLIASTHGDAALNLLRDYLADTTQDERARMRVVMTLGQAIKGKALDADKGIRFLTAIGSDTRFSTPLRQAVLVALGVSNQMAAVRYLRDKIGDPDVRIRVAVVDALARFSPPLTAGLDQLARHPDPAVRARAGQVLDKLRATSK